MAQRIVANEGEEKKNKQQKRNRKEQQQNVSDAYAYNPLENTLYHSINLDN